MLGRGAPPRCLASCDPPDGVGVAGAIKRAAGDSSEEAPISTPLAAAPPLQLLRFSGRTRRRPPQIKPPRAGGLAMALAPTEAEQHPRRALALAAHDASGRVPPIRIPRRYRNNVVALTNLRSWIVVSAFELTCRNSYRDRLPSFFSPAQFQAEI